MPQIKESLPQKRADNRKKKTVGITSASYKSKVEMEEKERREMMQNVFQSTWRGRIANWLLLSAVRFQRVGEITYSQVRKEEKIKIILMQRVAIILLM